MICSKPTFGYTGHEALYSKDLRRFFSYVKNRIPGLLQKADFC
ncbi:hypothetical protein HMPREF0083_04045 [Aneurinibacillus aneurinilyticus ATCC 12856]|uniref:Uncharacterized protein n=1 Tax=Aneurinibacillus aneurinilyticus ATCC 12856 TaxID=649747 RepID=U1WYV5_ANEAE|nr:hypothetical protein HMPREF0083_04045 [Aneurinibacillus aneurinilyticus ATCC 12856]